MTRPEPSQTDLHAEIARVATLSRARPLEALQRCEALLAQTVDDAVRLHIDALLAALAVNARAYPAAAASMERLATRMHAGAPAVDRHRLFRAAANLCRANGQLAAADGFLEASSAATNDLPADAAALARVGVVIDRTTLMLESDDAAGAIALLLGALRHGSIAGRPAWLQGCLNVQAAFVLRVQRDFEFAAQHIDDALQQLRGDQAERIRRQAEHESITIELARGGVVDPVRIATLHDDARARGDRLLAASALALRARRSSWSRPALAVEQALEATSELLDVGERAEAALLIDDAASWAAEAGDLYRAAQLQHQQRQLFADQELAATKVPSWVPPLLAVATECVPRRAVTRPPPDEVHHTPPPVDLEALTEQSRHNPEEAIQAGRRAIATVAAGPLRVRLALTIAAAHFNQGRVYQGIGAFAEALDGFEQLETPHEQLRALRMLTRLFEDAGQLAESEQWHLRLVELADPAEAARDAVSTRVSLGYLLHGQGRNAEALRWFLEAEALAVAHDADPSVRVLVILNLASLYRQLGRFTEGQDAIRRAEPLVPQSNDPRAVEQLEGERMLIRLSAGAPIDFERVRQVLADARRKRSYHLCATLGRALAEAFSRSDPYLAVEHAHRAQGDFEAAGAIDSAVAMTDMVVAARQRIGDPRAVADAEREGARLLRRRFGMRARTSMLLQRLQPQLERLRLSQLSQPDR